MSRLRNTATALQGWLLFLMLVVTLMLGVRGAVEYVPALANLAPMKRLIAGTDPTLHEWFEQSHWPWTRDARGIIFGMAAFVLLILRAMVGDVIDRLLQPPTPKPRPKAPPAQSPVPMPAGAAAAPATSGRDPDATELLPGTAPRAPIQSVTGTAFFPSQGAASGPLQHIGRYQILSELGRGAMGTVYKAEDPKIGRIVAIKTISAVGMGPELEQYRARFLVEAKSAGRLAHPNIVAVYDVADDDFGRPSLVLEFIDGSSLDDMTAEKQLPLPRTLEIMAQIARALGYAHEQGIVHRDVKPANIMITRSGQAKLSDFGIAKIEGTTLTLAGQVLGTPAFMSPEQCQGNPIDFRSDIFSFGAVLYTLVTGSKPFPGDTFTSVAYKVVHVEQVPVGQIDPALPVPQLDKIISRCLAKDPASRYSSATAVAEDLEALSRGTFAAGAEKSSSAEGPIA